MTDQVQQPTWAKLEDLKAGSKVKVDDGFTCIDKGVVAEVGETEKGLFIPCAHGKHFLDGQLENGHLIGIMHAE